MTLAFLRKPLAWAIGAAIIMLGVLWLIGQLTSGQRAKTEARLSRNQVEAATRSGADAVNTVGSQQARERAGDDLTRSNADEIRRAEGAGAPVADPADAAARASLCRRAAYRERPECLQHAPAR